MKKIRACIVTTVRNPGSFFGSFLRYHRAIGFERIYVFFDDPKDPSQETAKAVAGVKVILCDRKYKLKIRTLRNYSEVKLILDTEVTARQELNVEMALGFAKKEGFDWMFHIDADELIYNSFKRPIGEVLAKIPDEVEQVVCHNHEAVPQYMDIGNPFLDVTIFKKNIFSLGKLSKAKNAALHDSFVDQGRPYFFAYNHGKSGVRVRPHVTPHGVHNFGRFPIKKEQPPLPSAHIGELVVYHYPSCGFVQYLEKYRLVNPAEARWWKGAKRIGFHKVSTDAYLEKDFRKLEDLYKNNIQFSDNTTVAKLIKAGLMEKNTFMSNLIKKLHSRYLISKRRGKIAS